MKPSFCLSVLFIVLLSIQLRAQSGFFNPDQIQTLEITFANASWNQQLIDWSLAGDNSRLLATIVINGESFDSVGVRYRGSSSFDPSYPKNPLNIKLDYIKNHSYLGAETLKLTNGDQDPSLVREVLSYEIARKYMVAPGANYARVYINGEPWGIYINVENVDKDFVSNNFQSGRTRAFFEVDYNSAAPPPFGCNNGEGGSLEYLGASDVCYFNTYAMNSSVGWSLLRQMIFTLNFEPANIEQILDLDRFIWMCAFNNLLVNFDSYLGAEAKNFYLYESKDKCFNPVIWDLNESFGGSRIAVAGAGALSLQEMIELDPLFKSNDPARPLLERIMENDTYRRMYLAHLRTMLQENISNGWYAQRAQVLQNLISAEVQSDPKALYPFSQFQANLNQSVSIDNSPYPRTGINELMAARNTFLQNHPLLSAAAPSISNVTVSPNVAMGNTPVTISTQVSNANQVWLGHRASIYEQFVRVPMTNAGGGNYAAEIIASHSGVEYFIYAENNQAGRFSPERASFEYHRFGTTSNVVINELLASNGSIQADQDGEFDDWVELYNTTNQVISLAGYHLTDNASNPTKWTFPPATFIEPNGYLVVWLDNDLDQNGLHASFALSADGEELHIVSPSLEFLDGVVFGVQDRDVTYGRCPNGTGHFEFLPSASFLGSNDDACGTLVSLVELQPEPASSQLRAYPNPVYDYLHLESRSIEPMPVHIFDATGRLCHRMMLQGKGTWHPDVALPDGIYFIQAPGHQPQRVMLIR
jgi:hypothetical protein